jgi:peptide/nickel transport system permease protein
VKAVRFIAVSILVLTAAASLGAGWLAPQSYEAQFRESANAPPSRQFPLGTDSLGRDRFSRLLYGSRVSLLGAVGAALVAMAVATAIGLAAGYRGGWVDEIANGVTDLVLSLPWLFALLTLRALMPLNISPWASITATFLLLASVGWASGARVIRASVAGMRHTGPVLHARAYGCGTWRLLCFHLLPNLRPVLAAQFWILVPVFLLTEANLGVLGLGVVEPMPSWGSMLSELQNYQAVPESPWILAPAALLALVVACVHFAVSRGETWE